MVSRIHVTYDSVTEKSLCLNDIAPTIPHIELSPYHTGTLAHQYAESAVQAAPGKKEVIKPFLAKYLASRDYRRGLFFEEL